MSWNDYITNLMKSGYLTSASIVGHDGSVWARSNTDKTPMVSQEEVNFLNQGLDKTKQIDNTGIFYGNGVTLGGVKYVFLRQMDDHTLALKKDKCGAFIFQTCQGYIIGTYEDPNNGNANITVGNMGDYLRSLNF